MKNKTPHAFMITISAVTFIAIICSLYGFISGYLGFLNNADSNKASAQATMASAWAALAGGLLAAIAAIGVIWQTRQQIQQQNRKSEQDDARRRRPALIRIQHALREHMHVLKKTLIWMNYLERIELNPHLISNMLRETLKTRQTRSSNFAADFISDESYFQDLEIMHPDEVNHMRLDTLSDYENLRIKLRKLDEHKTRAKDAYEAFDLVWSKFRNEKTQSLNPPLPYKAPEFLVNYFATKAYDVAQNQNTKYFSMETTDDINNKIQQLQIWIKDAGGILDEFQSNLKITDASFKATSSLDLAFGYIEDNAKQIQKFCDKLLERIKEDDKF